MQRHAIIRLLVAVEVGALALLTACQRAESEAKPPAPVAPVNVQLVRPQRGAISRSVTLPGSVAAWQQATLYAKVGGYLKSIAVDKGDDVKAGDTLAEIEVPELLADRAKYRADVNVAEVDFKRVSEAQQKAPDLVTPQSVNDARGKFEIAQANLARIETLLGFTKIIAPFAGIITRRQVDPGAFIPAATSGSAAQNAALVTLADFSTVRVNVAVPEPEVPLVKKDAPALISFQELPGKTFTGTVARIAYALDDATRTMLAEIDLPNADHALRPGMYAIVKLGLEKHSDALLVPAAAVLVEWTRRARRTSCRSRPASMTARRWKFSTASRPIKR
ncbi:MAG: efflux RND transporter periplasmic adaptor subunit [Kiritimatiellaeota bacterium]|nr:efflux RND transporter periplasmic adaptor subunit [Kiritimatiellota bacterium]